MSDLPGSGIDRRTGRPLGGWPHVLQSLQVIFTTRFGERVMRQWFGSAIPALLGRENLTVGAVLRFKLAVWVAIELWEPRYRITHLQSVSVSRGGRYQVRIEGDYRPRAHLGDFRTESSARSVTLGG